LKTQIITLESHDDLISVRDKFSWAKTPRILLVWPKYEKIALRLLDLKVLHRHADSLGAQLGLVTRRANIKRDAESLGIPVFKSTAAAQKKMWPDSAPRSRRIPKAPRRDLRKIRDTVYEKEAAWRTSLLGRVITFTVGVIAVLTVAGIFVPHAALTLSPEAQIQNVVIPVAANLAVESVSVTGDIPAQTISVTVTAEQELTVTSAISVPTSGSKGIARFTNLSQVDVVIPVGTVVSTESSIKFVTLKKTLLPAGLKKFVDAPVHALELGAQGNVQADKIVIVEGPLALTASVTNPEAISGGTNSRLTGATEEDRATLRNALMATLHREAEAKMRAQINPADVLLMDTLEVAKIAEEVFNPAAGQPGRSLILTMRVDFSGQYVSEDHLTMLSLATLNSSAPPGFESRALPTYKMITSPSTDVSGVSHFELEVTRTLLRQMDRTQVFSLVRGHQPQSVKTDLVSELSLRAAPEITMTPEWWPWLPLIPFNISVEVK
jgi:hypothetical protein